MWINYKNALWKAPPVAQNGTAEIIVFKQVSFPTWANWVKIAILGWFACPKQTRSVWFVSKSFRPSLLLLYFNFYSSMYICFYVLKVWFLWCFKPLYGPRDSSMVLLCPFWSSKLQSIIVIAWKSAWTNVFKMLNFVFHRKEKEE